MKRRGHRRARLLVVTALAGAVTGAVPSVAHADPPAPWALRAIAGGPGQGVATSVAARPQAIGFKGHQLVVLGDGVVRGVDLAAGSADVLAGTGLSEPLTEQTHDGPTSAGPVGGVPGPARIARLGGVTHLFVRSDGSLVLSGYLPSNWATYEVSAAGRIRSAPCCSEYEDHVIPDAHGGYYYTDGDHQIRHRGADGSDTLLVGAQYDYAGTCPTGPALSANVDTLNLAQLSLDPQGRLVFAEPECVVRYDADSGQLVRLAGTDSGTGSTGDKGPAVDAHLDPVHGIAYDAAGELFIATGPEVREVLADGTITTVAGTGTSPVPANLPVDYYGSPYGPAPRTAAEIGDGGPALAASLFATGVAVDGDRLAIIDRADKRVRVVSPITPTGTITTAFGDGWDGLDRTADGAPHGHSLDGPARDAQLAPTGEATAPDGTLYVTTAWDTVAAIGANGDVRTVAGSGVTGQSPDGNGATVAALDHPSGVAVGADGAVYFVDHYDRIRSITPAGTLATVVGGGTDPGDGVPGSTAQISPRGRIAADPAGRLFWADDLPPSQPRIRSWDPATGLVTTVAGGGSSTGDGPALLAQLTAPLGAAVAPDGRVVFGDSERLRAVVAPGTPAAAVVTIAGQPGTSSCTAPAGGAGSVADQIALDRVADLVVAGSGDIFLADGSALERVDPQGRLTLLAGSRCSSTGAPFDAVGNDRATFYPGISTGLDADGAPLVVDSGAGRLYRATPDHVLPAPSTPSVQPGQGQLLVSWQPVAGPADSSGVRTYTVDAEPGHHVMVVYATTTHALLRGLDNGRTYSVTVSAQNTAGDSAASPVAQGRPGAVPPGPPRQLWVDPIAGGLVVHYQAPVNDGGSPVSSYVAVTSPGGVTATAPGGAQAVTIRGLAHRSYTVTVQARSPAGSGTAVRVAGTPDPMPVLGHTVVTSPRTHVLLTRSAGVRDVDGSDIALTDAGGHRVPIAIQCRSVSGALVDCAQQVVARIVVTPRSRLRAGARYSLVVDPAGDRYPITDLAGNALSPLTVSFRAGGAG